MADLQWTRQRSEAGPDLGLLQARFDWMRHPDGHVLRRLVLESCDWVNIVARDRQGKVILVRQFRFGIGSCTLEPPGGSVDPGERPLQAARRELLEETGYGGGRWTPLGAVEPNPALHPHLCHHFLADGVEPQQEPRPGRGEALEVVRADQDQVRAAVADGTIRHALALTALARVFPIHSLAED